MAFLDFHPFRSSSDWHRMSLHLERDPTLFRSNLKLYFHGKWECVSWLLLFRLMGLISNSILLDLLFGVPYLLWKGRGGTVG